MNLREEQRVAAKLKEDVNNLTSVIKKFEEDNIFLADFTKELEDTIIRKDKDHSDKVRKLQYEIEELLDYGEKTALEKKGLLESN